jgi:hypothetical protein
MGYEHLAEARKNGLAKRSKPVPRAEKLKAFSETWQRLRTIWAGHVYGEPKVAKGEAGSLRALVDLKCLDCCCGQRAEVRDCVVVACPLFPIRPYQSKDSDETEDQDET